VLITGAGPGGIGDALVRALAASGQCRVIATARSAKQLKALAALPAVLATLDLDVVSAKSIESCKRAVFKLTDGRGLDVLINNAGLNVKGTLLDSDCAAIERCFAVNVLGALAVTKAFAPAMAARRMGLVCNVGSAAGYVYGPIEAAYSATKNAVRALTDGLRVELAPLGVRVMLVAPGFVKTRIDDEREGAERKMWFPPRGGVGRGSGGGGSGGGGGGAASDGGGSGSSGLSSSSSHASSSFSASASASALAASCSPYALYAYMSRVVRTSIFELGPGVVHDSPEAFAARLAKAIIAEAPRRPRPVPRSALPPPRPAAASAADKAAAAALPPRKGGNAAALPAAPAAPALAAPAPAPYPAPPPALVDMLLEWQWWAPHALGGPRRHFRAAPFAGLTWLVGALAPMWAVDLVLGLYLGLWTLT